MGKIVDLSQEKTRRTNGEMIEITVLNIQHVQRQIRQLKTQIRFNPANNIEMVCDFNKQIEVYEEKIAKLIIYLTELGGTL